MHELTSEVSGDCLLAGVRIAVGESSLLLKSSKKEPVTT